MFDCERIESHEYSIGAFDKNGQLVDELPLGSSIKSYLFIDDLIYAVSHSKLLFEFKQDVPDSAVKFCLLEYENDYDSNYHSFDLEEYFDDVEFIEL